MVRFDSSVFLLLAPFFGARAFAKNEKLEEPCLAAVLEGRTLGAEQKLEKAEKAEKFDSPHELLELNCETPSGKFYKLEAKKDWILKKLGDGELVGGKTTLDIPIGTNIKDGVIKLNGSLVLKNNDETNQDRILQSISSIGTTSGEKTVLVVRVKTNSGSEEPTHAAAGFQDEVFGTGDDSFLSMKSQYKACSHDQLKFRPTENRGGNSFDIVNGFVEVSVSEAAGNNTDDCAPKAELTNAITEALKNNFDVNSPAALADHVMYCLPDGAKSNGGCAERPGWLSWFSDNLCQRVDFLVHEVGHNLGLRHASEGTAEYGDGTDAVSCFLTL